MYVCFSQDTLRELMMMYHHTKFGYKRLSASEDVFWSKHRQTNTLIQWFQYTHPNFVMASIIKYMLGKCSYSNREQEATEAVQRHCGQHRLWAYLPFTISQTAKKWWHYCLSSSRCILLVMEAIIRFSLPPLGRWGKGGGGGGGRGTLLWFSL